MFKRDTQSGAMTFRTLWYFHLIVILSMSSQLGGHVSCEFSYNSYEPEVFPIAVINFSYIDPLTSLPKIESGEIGRYGLGKLEDISGVVVHVTSKNHSSHTACDRLDMDRLPREPFIALVKEGDCKNHIKLRHIAEANASGALVYSSFDTRLFKIRQEGPVLPYVFIKGKKGLEIAAMVDNGTRVMMHIEVSNSNSFRYGNLNRTSVLFVSISFIILMVISMAWLVFYYVQRFRYIIAKDVLSKRLCSAAKKALDKIPVKTIKPKDCVDKEDEQECCAICIEPLQADEVIRVLPCKHSFHKVCVDPWLLEKRSCPMCKLDILRYFGLVYSGSQESVLELDDNNMHRRRSSAVISDILHIPISRRNSSSQTVPLTHDRATSPCSFILLVEQIEHIEGNSRDAVEVSIETSLLPLETNANSHDETSTDDAKLDGPCEFDVFLVENTSDNDSDE